ncbi:MAG: alpha-galactosidase [Ruminococcaceae bacterium]|jgi:alpha-galactosidase|nr:alpha-galactosidase [Oscillospiraceae bacterium]
MPITFISDKNLFKLDAAGATYVLSVTKGGYLLGLYWGGAIPDANFGGYAFRDYASSFSPSNPEVTEGGFSPDTAPLEFSGFGTGDFRKSAVSIRNADGNDATDFRYTGHRISRGKGAPAGMPATFAEDPADCETLEIDLADRTTGAELTLFYTVFEDLPVVTRYARLKNASQKAMDIEKISSASVQFAAMDFDFIHLYGRWGAERNWVRSPLAHGHQSISSARGSSSHYHNPFAALARCGADEDRGEVYGFNLVYSGSFDITADVDYYETTRLNMGINPEGFLWHLEPGEVFDTPEAVLVYSKEGLGGMSRAFHRLYLDHLIRGKYRREVRPLLINSWEAAYFDFDTDKLVSFAERAKEIGIDMLVMDDGWFSRRNDDRSSLGDWWVNEDKLPGGLGVLIDRVNALGLKFGIWYEPEMISPDSDIYRAHPDWCLHVPDRPNSIARHQYVIDMSRQDVRDNIWEQMNAVLSKYKIDYVKWDFNRNLTEAGSALLSAPHGEEIFHRFVLGTYELMGRLVDTYPDLLLENCSGGGGRFDPGMLYFSPQIWASDNTDAIERLAIQFGTSLCYPASTMGAHVSMSRRTGFETKGNVAMWGTFGYELDPNRLTEKDLGIVKKQVADYHKYYELIHYGDLYRITDPWDNAFRCAWEFVSQDKNEALFTHVTMRYYHCPTLIVRFKGLDPNFTYTLESTGEKYSGAFLMNAGLNLSLYPRGTGESFVLHFVKEN